MTKFVTIPGNNGSHTVYHTSEECKRIKSDTKEIDDHYVQWHKLRECEWCKHGTKAALENE